MRKQPRALDVSPLYREPQRVIRRPALAPQQLPDGTCLAINTDLLGTPRTTGAPGSTTTVGPLAALKAGVNRIRVW
jgi:hypothetical protein